MTYIEFFAKDAIENICACLTEPPEKVILIGDKGKVMKKEAERYREILASRGAQVEFSYRGANRNDLGNLVEILSEIVETEEECAFGLTGGEDLCLVAMGIVFQKYPEKKIQMHRFNIQNNRIIDCDEDGKTLHDGDAPDLTVEENIRIYGGEVVYDTSQEAHTYQWDWNDEFRQDVSFMWDVCRKNVRFWNTQCSVLSAIEMISEEDDPLTASVPKDAREEFLKSVNVKYIFVPYIFRELHRAGIVTFYQCDEETFRVSYKNEQIRRCMTKAGQVLEMKIYMAAKETTEKDGTPTYNDVKMGVYIDWDGETHGMEEGYDTGNEIDVLLMHGMVPVFISCKNGHVTMEELYKLNTVAQRFGGKYAKKVLVATALEGAGSFAEHFRQRAKDMDIRLMEGVQEMDDSELQRIVKSLWCN